jgi:fatty acid desaturase
MQHDAYPPTRSTYLFPIHPFPHPFTPTPYSNLPLPTTGAGAFLTLDRPYGRLFDWLHHRIGSTHVAHHIDCTIPHYHAREATDAIAAAFPKAYLYDPTPVHQVIPRW